MAFVGMLGTCRRGRQTVVCVAGRVRQVPDKPVAAGDAITLLYSPPSNFFQGRDLHFAGGYNGWNGDDVPLMTPAEALMDGEYRVVVTIPNFAKVVDFAFSDGVRYDTNDGQYFHIPVRFQQRMDKDGDLETFDAASDAERTVSRAEFRGQDGDKIAAISVEEEERLHESRAKAAIVAREFDLGAIYISQATAAFDRADKLNRGLITMEDAIHALDELGFQVEAPKITELLREFAGADDSHDFEVLTASDFIVAYAQLEADDEDLEIL